MTRLTLLLSGACLVGCSTFYRIEFPLEGAEPTLSSTPIVHCLQSMGFEDRSHEDYMPEMMAEDPALLAKWLTTAGHGSSMAPGSQVFVYRRADRWSVSFVPGTKGGDLSRFFADMFARCISLHDPGAAVEIHGYTTLDLR